jgi:hypothetical protein
MPQSTAAYQVRMRHADGSTEVVRPLQSNGTIAAVRIPGHAAARALAATWEITDAIGNVILTTARL